MTDVQLADMSVEVVLETVEVDVEFNVGVPGPPGTGALPYVHTQATPAAVWEVQHNLGYDPPGIRVHSDDGDDLGAVIVHYTDPGAALRATFDSPISGTLRAG